MHRCIWASLTAQLAKNPPEMQETPVWFLGQEDPFLEGTSYPFQYFWSSLVAQPVNNLHAMQETWVPSLGLEDPLEKGKATHSNILAWRIPWARVYGVVKSWTWLSEFHFTHTHTHTHTHTYIYIYTKQTIIQRSERGKQLLFVTTWMGLEDSMPSEISRHRRTNIVWALHIRNLKQSCPQNKKIEQWWLEVAVMVNGKYQSLQNFSTVNTSLYIYFALIWSVLTKKRKKLYIFKKAERGNGRKCLEMMDTLMAWSWWWLLECILVSKLIKLYALNLHSFCKSTITQQSYFLKIMCLMYL